MQQLFINTFSLIIIIIFIIILKASYDDLNQQAIAHHWRYEVISGDGGGYEGMLLYLQKPHFIKSHEAVQEWNRDALDALVVPKDKISEFIRKLQNAVVARLRSIDQRTDPQIGYFLVTRRS